MSEKGLIVDVYRDSGGDCTLNGVSSKYDRFVLIGEVVDPVFEPSEDIPAIYLQYHCDQPIAVPKEVRDGKWGMYGGNFLYTCDSRFRQNVNPYPIRIHDRIEG